MLTYGITFASIKTYIETTEDTARIRVKIRFLPVGLARVYPGSFLCEQVLRACAPGAMVIIDIVNRASVKREASTPDAAVQFVAQLAQVLDPTVQMVAKAFRELMPIAGRGRAAVGQLIQLRLDLVQFKSEPLRRHDERHAANLGAGKPAMTAAIFVRLD